MSKRVIHATWDDVPHLSPEAKQELWASIPPYQRKPRSKGIPQLGSGLIYPVDEEDYVITDHEIPKHWPRGFGMDVGWNRTAALWGALNRETDVLTLYSEHYKGEAEPLIHAESIRARGAWIKGAIDPAARGRSQLDGRRVLTVYEGLGLKLELAPNALEGGIYEVWTRLSTGRLKVFKSCVNFLSEIRVYRRDEKGKIPEGQADHLMACLRYLILAGIEWLQPVPSTEPLEPEILWVSPGDASSQGWMSG